MGDAPEVKESPQQKAFAQIAAERFADYQKRWLPVQRQLTERVRAMGRSGSAERRQAEGKAATDTAVRFGEAKAGLEGALTQSGAAPGSGKFAMATAGLGIDEATSRAGGFMATDAAIDDAYLKGLASIAQLGRGESASAIKGMGDVAAMSGRQAQQDAEMSLADRAGDLQLAGQVAGLGAAFAAQPRAPAAPGFSGANDFAGVTPDNSMNEWLRVGSSGD